MSGRTDKLSVLIVRDQLKFQIGLRWPASQCIHESKNLTTVIACASIYNSVTSRQERGSAVRLHQNCRRQSC